MQGAGRAGAAPVLSCVVSVNWPRLRPVEARIPVSGISVSGLMEWLIRGPSPRLGHGAASPDAAQATRPDRLLWSLLVTAGPCWSWLI